MKTLIGLPVVIAVGLVSVKSWVLPYWQKPLRVWVGFKVVDEQTGKPIPGATFRVWGEGGNYFNRIGNLESLTNLIDGATRDWQFEVSAAGYDCASGTLGSVLKATFFEGKLKGPPTTVRLKRSSPALRGSGIESVEVDADTSNQRHPTPRSGSSGP